MRITELFKRMLLVVIMVLLSMSVDAQYNRRGSNNTSGNGSSLVEDAAKGVVNGVKGLFSKKKDKSDDKDKKDKKDKKKDKNKGSKSKSEPLASDDIELIVSGDGATKEQATLSALRSAIEQAYGTFVSSNTQILDDELISDNIVSISQGNIKQYEYISEFENNGENHVTLKAVVSIGKLVSYAKSKGSSAELAGASFAMDIKMKKLNRMNAIIAYDDFIEQLEEIIPLMFDFSLELGSPTASGRGYAVDATVTIKSSKNYKAIREYIMNTLESLCITRSEYEEYERKGIKYLTYDRFYSGKHNPFPAKCESVFREDGWYGMFALYSNVGGNRVAVRNIGQVIRDAFQFAISDNLGGEVFSVTENSGDYSIAGAKGVFDANEIFNYTTYLRSLNYNPLPSMGWYTCGGDYYPFPIEDKYNAKIKRKLYYSESEIGKISKVEINPVSHRYTAGHKEQRRKNRILDREEYFKRTGLK